MSSEVARKLVKSLDALINEDDLGGPFLSSHNYRAYPLSVNHFNTIKTVESDRKFAFVDGGNQELVAAPNFSVQLNRVYFNVFAGRRRIQPSSLTQRIEFFSVTSAKFRNDQIFFDTELFPVSDQFDELIPDTSDLSFNSTDRRITVGNSRADIARVASIARRFAEWQVAKHVVMKEIDEGDVLVMDGTLRTAFANESKYARAAYTVAKDKGVLYTGLSKTSHLFTTTGLSLMGALRKLAEDNKIGSTWYYYPVAESLSPEHEAAIFIIKLNSQSPRIFRYEIQSEQSNSLDSKGMNEIFSQLSINASDLSFPGYPYGLIDADDNARVRYEELEAYRVMLLSEISKLGSSSKFLRHMQSIDTHGVLNLLRETSYT
jgi:NurA domain